MGPGSPFGVPGKYLATVVYQGLGNNLLPHHERMRTQTSYAYHMFIDIYNEIITHPILICNFVAKLHFSKHSSPEEVSTAELGARSLGMPKIVCSSPAASLSHIRYTQPMGSLMSETKTSANAETGMAHFSIMWQGTTSAHRNTLG